MYYRTKSTFNGEPLVVILTDRSKNTKTGNMIQSWILPAALDPFKAVKKGKDKAACGNCKLRRFTGGTCYVRVARAPLSVWKAWKAGKYPEGGSLRARQWLRRRQGRAIRLGAYGDPGVVPIRFWRFLLDRLEPRRWTGYTHQWRMTRAAGMEKFLMASVDTPAEYRAARRAGWRTFRVRQPGEPLLPGEFICPASFEAKKRLTCLQCGACNGNPHNRPRAGNVAIFSH